MLFGLDRCCGWCQQASADLPDLLPRVKELMKHEDFTLKNPNRLRSVVTSFAGCQDKFHAIDGSGYKYMGDMVLEVDKLNPQVRGMALPRGCRCLVCPFRPVCAAAPTLYDQHVCDHARPKTVMTALFFSRTGFLTGC